MQKKSLAALVLLLVAAFVVGANAVLATYTNESQPVSTVKSITLTAGGDNQISWSTNGNSVNGFKIAWSLNPDPTYPLRSGDQYHYYAEPNKSNDTLEAFSGDGIYYVRVCEYLGGKCGLYSNQVKMTLSGSGKKAEPIIKKENKEPVACTMDYNPVCGQKKVVCIKAPCDPIKTTYSNKCMLSAAKAEFLYAGECKKEAAKPRNLTVENNILAKKAKDWEKRVGVLQAENKRLKDIIKAQQREIAELRALLGEE
ncbi:hypothetical protein HGA34_05025 [Candidatus Falkowbacteria bacterium]|nr:hypothetical protein [Candidatus Falkowbacteria bacterium]